MFLPIENQPRLIADLEGDPFVGHALSSTTCELYHRYGMFLAPLTAVLTTLKHYQFGHFGPVRVHDGGDEAGESSSGKSYGESKGSKKSGSRACRRCRLKGKARRTTSRAASSSQGTISLPRHTCQYSSDKAVSRPERHEGLTNWTPWIVGACLAGGALVFLRQTRSHGMPR